MELLLAVLGNQFVQIVIGTFIAAVIGVMGAQVIIERARKKTADLRELRQTNAAITLAISISNTMMTIKNQHALPMKTAYEGHRKRYDEAQTAFKAGNIPLRPVVFEFILDSFQMPVLPVVYLQKIVFEDLNLIGRPLTLTAQIQQTAETLADLLTKRNEQLLQFQKLGNDDKVAFYFGVAGPSVRDRSFPQVLDGIVLNTDDEIFFPNLLIKDLQLHGEGIRKRLGRDAPGVTTHVTTEKFKELLPSDEDYRDWINNFPKREIPKSRWRFWRN